MYIALLSVLILLQAAALLLLFTNNEWRQHIPGKGGPSRLNLYCHHA